MTIDDKIVDLEFERISRLPILNPNLENLKDITMAYANQLFQLGHMDVTSCFPVGSSFVAEVSVKIVEVKKES